MKKLVFISLLVVFVIPSTSLYAGQLQKHIFEIGPEVSYIEYEEPGLMEQKGWMYGIVTSYSYHNKYMVKAEGRASFGEVDYSSPISGTLDNIEDYIIELRAVGGYDFPVSEVSFLTAYFGIGYRYLNDDMAGKVSSAGHLGYERESNYFYSPLGFKFIADLKAGWSLGVVTEYDIFWSGQQYSNLSDVDPGLNDVRNTQSSGYGLRGSVDLEKRFKTAAFAIEPFIRYWKINDSRHVGLTYYGDPTGWEAYEPQNHSTEYGINLLVRF